LTIQEPVEYHVAKSADAEGIIRLIATAFSASEPLAVAMSISAREMEGFLEPLMPAAIAEGLTIVARQQGTGKLAGALLNDDFGSPLPVDPSRLSTKFSPIISLLETLDERYRVGRTIAPGEYLHLFMLAADARLAGRGIGRALVEASLENGISKGYRMTVSEATAGASQHIFRKLGFADRFLVPYRDFAYEDRAAFRSIQDPPGAILMDKSLLG
jgi:ribosomal protein S18 acetylase RimI-like enzyme